MNILITCAGRRVSLVRAFQKELKLINPHFKVYAADFEPKLSAACHVADGYFEVPLLNDVNYIDTLLNYCQKFHIKLLIPCIDTELLELSQHKARFESLGIKVVISSENFVNMCRNKRLIHTFFKENNIQHAHEFSKIDFKFPVFIKPADGSRSMDTYFVKSENDLREEFFNDNRFMFLEYLDSQLFDEFTCDLYYDKTHHLKCVVPRKRLEVRDGEVYKSLAQKNYLVSYIRERLSFIDGAVGCLTSQFFLSKNEDQKVYGIEINPRFGGGFPLSYLAGANFPKWIIKEYLLNKTIDDQFDVWEDNLLMIRYDDEVLVHGYKG